MQFLHLYQTLLSKLVVRRLYGVNIVPSSIGFVDRIRVVAIDLGKVMAL